MIKFIYHSIFLLAFSLVAKAQTVVQNLLVEQKSHPMGIATSTPVFSWQLQSEQRNIKQKGYEILVASSKALLENNVGNPPASLYNWKQYPTKHFSKFD